MKKLILCMHTSLDRYVAGPNGEMDWIIVNEELFEIASYLTDHADTALYGRVTWQMMEDYWPNAGDKPNATKHDIQHSKWYNSVPKFVVSRTMNGGNNANVKVIGKNLAAEVGELKEGPGKNIIIFGSPSTSHSLMENNLIDEYWLFLNPILVGTGIPMFRNIKQKENLKLEECRVFSSGVICLNYRKKE